MEIMQREFSNVRIQVPWGFIAGRWYGSKKLRPILALHGWLDNLGTFDRLIPLMPPHVDVLSIDLPGHGRSSKMPKGILYNHTHFITVILLIMREYKWDKISFMGHSMGGILSFLFASFYPDRVDMVITIDIAKTRYDEPAFDIEFLNHIIEKSVIENERLVDVREPPSYTYDEMEKLLNHTGRSIDLENCKYILDRNILKSTKYPGKFYFSRDARLKTLSEFKFSAKSNAEIAKTIPLIPYLIIKGSDSTYIDESSHEVISVLKKNNPLFEFHEISGRHHLHLNNPNEVSAVLNRFINRHRPLKLMNCSLETMSEQASWNEEQTKKSPPLSKL